MNVFISHSWSDKSLATQINETLRKDGHEVWYDIHRLLPGDAIQDVIDAEIEKSDVVVLLWTKHALVSDGVKAEINKAQLSGKRIIPLQADQTGFDQHQALNGILGIPFHDVPTGLLLLQRCLLMLMAAEYKDAAWFKEAFENVVDLGGYLNNVNTYRLQNGKNEDGSKEQWVERLEEMRRKNEHIRQHVMTEARDKMLMLQNIMQRLEHGAVPLSDLKQWQQWCSANLSFQPGLMEKLKQFIENDMARLQSGGPPVSILDADSGKKTVQRLQTAIDQKKEAANQAMYQRIKSFAGFLLGDKMVQSIVNSYLNYVVGSPKLLQDLLQEAQTSGFVAVKEVTVLLLNYLEKQDHQAELQKNNLDGFIDDAYLIHNTAKLLLEAKLLEKEEVSVDFISANVVDKYVSFLLDSPTKTKLDEILLSIRHLIGLKKSEINWGGVAAAAIGVTAVAALLSESAGTDSDGSRSSTFEDRVSDFNAQFGTSFNV